MGLAHDPEKVTRLLNECRAALKQLREIGQRPEEEVTGNRVLIGSVKYELLVATEATLDLAYHLIARNGFRQAQDYADVFRVLAEEGILDEDLSQRLEDMARFRNRLVHLYWDVDDHQVYRIIREELSDIDAFIDSVTDQFTGP